MGEYERQIACRERINAFRAGTADVRDLAAAGGINPSPTGVGGTGEYGRQIPCRERIHAFRAGTANFP